MKKSVLSEKSFQFAKSIVVQMRLIMNEQKEFVLTKQLLRSGTAVGALEREAKNAESRRDFIHKLAIAQKECGESEYWLDLMIETGILDRDQGRILKQQCCELMRLLTSILKTTKRNGVKG